MGVHPPHGGLYLSDALDYLFMYFVYGSYVVSIMTCASRHVMSVMLLHTYSLKRKTPQQYVLLRIKFSASVYSFFITPDDSTKTAVQQ